MVEENVGHPVSMAKALTCKHATHGQWKRFVTVQQQTSCSTVLNQANTLIHLVDIHALLGLELKYIITELLLV